MIINESTLINMLSTPKDILLVEPPYKRSYIPLGLAKIASLTKSNGSTVEYSRGDVNRNYDLICVATCFTTDAETVLKTLHHIRHTFYSYDTPIIVGGIFASLMPEYIINNSKNVSVFTGYSDILDRCIPDYSLDYQVSGFFKDVMTLFTTRGCPNRCGFCMVHRLEPKFHISSSWKENIEQVNRQVCVVSDNNFLTADINHIRNVVESLNQNNKKVIFNNGIDCRTVTEENAELLASLSYIRNGFRTAFDSMEDDEYYQKAMELLIDKGLKIKGNSYTYVLFNYTDTPQDAYYRVKIAWTYRSNPYFMQYRPLNLTTHKNTFIGKYWTTNLVKAFRNYGLNFGYNRGDTTFETWAKNENSNIKLTDDDWDHWYYKKENNEQKNC